jgi:hypothetical protein
VSSAPLIGCEAAAMGEVGGEDGASSYGKGNVEEEFHVEGLMTATVLHRGLISGYPAP